MSIQLFFTTIGDSILALGLLWFLGLVIIDIIFWRIHPAIGTIGALLILAYLLHLF